MLFTATMTLLFHMKCWFLILKGCNPHDGVFEAFEGSDSIGFMKKSILLMQCDIEENECSENLSQCMPMHILFNYLHKVLKYLI